MSSPSRQPSDIGYKLTPEIVVENDIAIYVNFYFSCALTNPINGILALLCRTLAHYLDACQSYF